jgi:hypothetical protein
MQTEKAKQETRSLSELLALEKKETVKQRELVALYAGIIEELQEEAGGISRSFRKARWPGSASGSAS